jgi:uncharacterized protein (DUF924 family)
MKDAEKVLSFWFGELDEHGHAHPSQAKRWFQKNSDFDREVHEQFEAMHRSVADGRCERWLETPRGTLAYVIVLDQLSRNMFRGTAEMFAHDASALRAALRGVDRADDQKLGIDERSFLYMPLMHSEDPKIQDRSVALFEKMRDAVRPERRERYAASVRYAETHRDIIKRFGRFPHRNSILDRTSTPDEVEFLTEPNAAF